MRELRPDPLPRDHITIWVPSTQWTCPLCVPDGGEGVYTTVEWLYRSDGPDGRCSRCGLKLSLAAAYESVPTVAEQLRARGESV